MRNKIILIIMFISITFYFMAFHNIDLLSNYALLLNDINKENHFKNNYRYYDLRDVSDCTHFNSCPDYTQIYKNSQLLNSISFIFLLFCLGVLLWQKK